MKYLVHWLLASLCLFATAHIVPGFHFDGFGSALIASLVIGLLNILVWPVLLVLTLPLTILTFGLFLFVLNAIILAFGASLVPGFSISSFGSAFLGALLLTIMGALVRFVFAPKQP